MSREIQYDSSQRAVVDNLYAAIFNSALQVWNGSAFVEWSTAPTASACLVQLSELGAGPLYAATMPAGIVTLDPQLANAYAYLFFDQTSGSIGGGALLSALPAIGQGAYVDISASAMWSNTQRTLTGTGGAIGPTAGANLGPIAFGPVVPGQTLDLSACVSINGQYITAEETSAIVYTIVDCDSGLPVPGHVGVALVPATPYVGTPGTCCLSDTILTDAEASNYNFRFRPSLASKSPFPECGRYAVAVTFTVGGQPYFANFRGEARW